MIYIISPTDQLKQRLPPNTLLVQALAKTFLWFNENIEIGTINDFDSDCTRVRIKTLFVGYLLNTYLKLELKETRDVRDFLLDVVDAYASETFDRWWNLEETHIHIDLSNAIRIIPTELFRSFHRTVTD